MSTFGKQIVKYQDQNAITAFWVHRILISTHLDGLPIDAGSVELPHRGLGGIFVHHGDEGVALAGVVDIGDLAAPVIIFPFNDLV